MSESRIALPSGGVVVPMQQDPERFRHVFRHLYAQDERWEQVVSVTAAELRRRAGCAGCTVRELGTKQPSYFSASPECRAHVLADYARFYRRAYWDAIAQALASGHWASDEADPDCTYFVGDRGVVVMTRWKKFVEEGAHVVVSARRPWLRGVHWRHATQADFFQQAIQDLARQTSYGRKSTR